MITLTELRQEPSHVNGEITQRAITGNLLRNQKEIDNPASDLWSNHSGILATRGKQNQVFPALCNSC